MPPGHGPLSIADLLPHGPLRRLGRRAFPLDTVESTNTFLLRQAAEVGDGAAAWADSQDAKHKRLKRR